MPDSPDDESKDEAHTAAVQGLFVRFQPAIRGYILAMIPDFATADDVMQETFLVVTRKAASFELGTSFPAWVKTIARFKCLEMIRARQGRFECLSDEVLEALGAEESDFSVNTDERLIHLAECIDRLAPQARRSIDFRYRQDHSPQEIAGIIGCATQSVNVTLSRARSFLRDCVERRMASTTP
jgi:RNA polymerase sigma-70 factor (ECF subfamily)